MTDVFNINYSNIFGGEKVTRPNRKLVAAQKQEYLKLPASYQEIPEEEMYYIDGGAGISVNTAGLIFDGILMVCGIGAAALGLKISYKAIKFFSKAAARTTKRKIVGAMSSALGSVAKAVFGFTLSSSYAIADYICDIFLGGGLGYAVALGIDMIDGNRNGILFG